MIILSWSLYYCHVNTVMIILSLSLYYCHNNTVMILLSCWAPGQRWQQPPDSRPAASTQTWQEQRGPAQRTLEQSYLLYHLIHCYRSMQAASTMIFGNEWWDITYKALFSNWSLFNSKFSFFLPPHWDVWCIAALLLCYSDNVMIVLDTMRRGSIQIILVVISVIPHVSIRGLVPQID